MKIYFCGSMTGSREKQANYEEIIKYLNTFGKVLNEFVGDKKVTDYKPENVFARDTENMKNSDVCIADISVPSTGVGFELGYFYHLNVPVLLVYDENMPLPSSLPRGADKFKVVSYSTIQEEKNKLKEFLENI